MARGGARPGAGRKKGAPNRKTAETVAAVEASGLTPLDYMLSLLRDAKQPAGVRFEAAKAAAPYVHAKRIAVGGDPDAPPIEQATQINLVAVPAKPRDDGEDR